MIILLDSIRIVGQQLENSEYCSFSALIKTTFLLFLAHVIPGVLLLAIPYIEDTNIVIAVLTMSLGFNGAATLTNLQNSHDLAPNFAGTLYAIINFIGMSSGFFGPLVKTELAHYGKIVSVHF